VTLKQKKPGKFCVRFFGTNDYAWTTLEKTLPYTQKPPKKSKKKNAKLDQAYKEAEEVFVMSQKQLMAGLAKHQEPSKFQCIKI
jgi:hypothetical protein